MSEKRTVSIKVRMTPSEHEQLKELSTRAELARWIREFCLSNGERKKSVSPIPKVAPELLYQIAGIGNNINQMARRINSKKEFTAVEKVHVISALSLIDSQLSEIIRSQENVK